MSKPRYEKNINVPEEVLVDLLTPSEIRMLKNRWQIVSLLNEGLSIRVIAEQVGVGTDTVVRVSRMIEKKSAGSLMNSSKKIKSTSWVFGKGDD